MSDCPLSLDVLPKPLHKHADEKAPLPLRLMGAKGLVPAVAAPDLVTLLYFLAFDPEGGRPGGGDQTAEGLPDKIYGVALRTEGLRGPVLDWLADRFAGKEQALELILLNPSTLDETMARLAPTVSQPLGGDHPAERAPAAAPRRHHPGAVPEPQRAGLDHRRRLRLLRPQRAAAARRAAAGGGPQAGPRRRSPAQPPVPEETAATLMSEYRNELDLEKADGVQRGVETAGGGPRKLNMTQRILKMSVSQKIKLATLGNQEARTLLLRDSNKLVCMAAVTSPRITDGEILGLANSRTVNSDVLRYIYSNREFTRTYVVKAALVKNPKVPLPIALKMMFTLQEKDIKELARDRNVPQTIQSQAKAFLMKKEQAARANMDKKQ